MNKPKIRLPQLLLILFITLVSAVITGLLLIIADLILFNPLVITPAQYSLKIIFIETLVFTASFLILRKRYKKSLGTDPAKATSYRIVSYITIVLYAGFIFFPLRQLCSGPDIDQQQIERFLQNEMNDTVTGMQADPS